jgi:predicted NBD/HSP70 family sugar kinase
MSSADAAGRDPARGGPGVEVSLGPAAPSAGLRGLRRSNTALVAKALLQHGALARADIAAVTGLSATSVTKITAQMMRAHLLTELSAVSGDPGRPRIPVVLDPTHYRFVGIHIGLRRTTGGLLDLTGNVVAEHAVTHRRQSQKAILTEVRELRGELEDMAGGPRWVLGTGVATGGRVDPTAGLVVDHPVLGWKDVHLADQLDTGEHPLLVDNSVRAMALAESYLGVTRDVRSSLFLFIGNIVGAGFMLDGRLRQGHDAAAGTIDHLPVGDGVATSACPCGRTDCLAAVASDVAVLRRARETGLVRPRASFESLVARSRSGDDRAVRLLRQRAVRAGTAAALLLDLLDPDLLVLGGGLLQTPEYLDDLRASAADRLSRPEVAERILPTGLGQGSLVRGSGSLVMDAFFSDPVGLLPALVAAT